MEIKINDQASFSKTLSESDVYNYVGIVGDINPLHIDKIYAKKTRFKKRIVHGLLVTGLISTVIGNKLPGEGTIYLSQNSRFLAPVFIGDTIKALVRVVDVYSDGKIKLYTECRNQDGVKVIDGEAVVMLENMKSVNNKDKIAMIGKLIEL